MLIAACADSRDHHGTSRSTMLYADPSPWPTLNVFMQLLWCRLLPIVGVVYYQPAASVKLSWFIERRCGCKHILLKRSCRILLL